MNMTVGDGDVLKSAKGPELLFIPANVNTWRTENGKLVNHRVWHPLLEKHHSASSLGGFLGLGKPLGKLNDSPLPRKGQQVKMFPFIWKTDVPPPLPG